MRICILGSVGIFATDNQTDLPATVKVMGRAERAVLDGTTAIEVVGGSFELPADLPDGVHTLGVDGVLCEPVRVKQGKVRPVGIDTRTLLPTLFALNERVQRLEEILRQKEINWLV